MAENFDFSQIKWDSLCDAILAALRVGLDDLKGNLVQGWEEELKQIALYAEAQAPAAMRGEEAALANMQHLMAQAVTVGAIIAMKEEKAVIRTIQNTIKVVFTFLAPIAKTAILAL